MYHKKILGVRFPVMGHGFDFFISFVSSAGMQNTTPEEVDDVTKYLPKCHLNSRY